MSTCHAPRFVFFAGATILASVAGGPFSATSRAQTEAPPTTGTLAPYRCAWTPVAGADYYDGRLGSTGESVRFRTSETMVIVPGTCEDMILTPRVKSGAPVAGSGEIRPTLSTPLAARPPSASGSKAPNTDAAETAVDSEPEDYEKEEGTVSEPEATGAAGTSSAPSSSRRTVLSTTVWLGVGKEWVTGKSGVTEFKGNAHIGGTSVEARWLGRSPSLYGVASLGAHRFRTAVEETEGTDTEAKEREAKVLRLAARLGLLHAFSPEQPQARAPVIAMGGGIAYLRLPVLALANDEEGTARIDAASVFGPWLGGVGEWSLGTDDVFGLNLSAGWAMGWEKARATVLAVETHWRHDLTESLSADGAAVYERADIKAPVECNGRDSCTSHGNSESALVQFRLGVGWHW